MTDEQQAIPIRRRRSSEEVLRKRKALIVAKPYLDRFPDWQRRAAYISAALLARTLTDEERLEQHDMLRTLIAEVEAARDEFDKAAMREVRHSRVDDVRNAFRRLVDILHNTSR